MSSKSNSVNNKKYTKERNSHAKISTVELDPTTAMPPQPFLLALNQHHAYFNQKKPLLLGRDALTSAPGNDLPGCCKN